MNITEVDCREEMFQLVDKFVPVVEKWSEEHPQRTFKDDFLEKFPKSKYENCCVDYVYGTNFREECVIKNCTKCWNQPLPLNEMKHL